MAEVQSHLVARSLHPATGRKSEFTELRSKLTEELYRPKFTPSISPRSRHSSQEDILPVQDKSLPHAITTDSSFGSGQSTPTALAAIHNMSRLQAKIMSLQGEALRVTYSIDQVNQCMVEWHEHKEDLKRAVERRSAQFQFFIKRMEHQLTAEIDGKHADDSFYAESDRCKVELRKILKNILHEVSVLKSLQEHGTDTEINTFSANLLCKSVGMTDVILKKFHYDMSVPTQAIEDMVTACFGEVRLNPKDISVFSPDILDFNEIPMGNVEPVDEVFPPSYHRDGDTPTMEDENLQSVPAGRSSDRSFSDSGSRRHSTNLGLAKHNVTDHLAQFQTAQETLRTRRKEILVRGQKAREDVSPLRDEALRRPTSPFRRGRVHSLDRILMPTTRRSTGMALRPDTYALTTERKNMFTHSEEAAFTKPQAFTFQYRTGASHSAHGLIPEDFAVPSPVIEEVTFPQKRLVKQKSDPHSEHDKQPTPEESSEPEVSPQSHPQSKSEQFRHRLPKPGSSLYTGRRHSSDLYTPLSHDEDATLDLLHDGSPARLIRRAISSGADRKTKMEFLRENWQKRKEILIQNEGFVSPDSASQQPAVKPSRSFLVPHIPTKEKHVQEMHICLASSPTIQAPRQELPTTTASNLKTTLAQIPSSTQAPSSLATSAVPEQLTTQTTPAPTAENNTQTTTSTSSRYSKFPTKPRESLDVAPLTSAMYSGKERPAMHSTKDTNTDPSDNPAEEKDSRPLTSNCSEAEKHTNITTASELLQSAASPQQRGPRYASAMSSRFSEGINRRHTIEIGKTALQNAQQIASSSILPSSAITSAETVPYTAAVSPVQHSYYDRFSQQIRKLGASTEPYAASPPLADPLAHRIKDPTLTYKITEMTTRILPSPIEIRQDSTPLDHSIVHEHLQAAASSLTTPPPSPSTLQTPGSPNLNGGTQKVRMREIARRKKERWRHLTIH